MHDFHTHTFLGDGLLSPIEMIRNAVEAGYEAIALTEHTSSSSLKRVISELSEDCRIARENWEIQAFAGVELTHLPAKEINVAAKMAKEYGAQLVLVHGETIVEPVEKGTNYAALSSEYVDILAHPGLISAEEARIASEMEILLEISSRRGHCLTNGIVRLEGKKTGARFLINSDAHAPSDLHNVNFVRAVGRGAGFDNEELDIIIQNNTKWLIEKLNSIRQ